MLDVNTKYEGAVAWEAILPLHCWLADNAISCPTATMLDSFPSNFQLLKTDTATAARRGRLSLPHGTVETPIFMPVGTQATVKGLTPKQIEEVGAQIILSNTYHLNLRPGSDLVRDRGGLHPFMHWQKPILTDSGGFQVFSLAKLRKLEDAGIRFKSHLDGKEFFLGPREVMAIQDNLYSDVAMVLDECPPQPVERKPCEEAVERSLRWAQICLEEAFERGYPESGRKLFAIVQGSAYKDLREHCADRLVEMDFPGYAVGGLSVGETEPEMMEQASWTLPRLPAEKPRYIMGVGTPPQLLKLIALGADMFDCVMPTRAARHGTAFTPWGTVNIRNARFRNDESPLVPDWDNYACRHFSRAYIRHLIIAGESLGGTLLTIHNLHFFLTLMAEARKHLECGDYGIWHKQWIANYESNSAAPE